MEEYIDPAQEQSKEKTATTVVSVCDIQFRSGSKIYYFDPNGFPVKAGSHVIIDTARGPEFGYCTAGKHTVTIRDVVLPLRKVLRMATPEDERIKSENTEKEKRAFEICLNKIEELGLEMQLVSTEYAFDGSKALFFFTADGRVDFRELVKSLAATLRTRIELRQIGMRDKAKMVGGFGICGRPFCCAQFLDDFQPVSIKMAKTQNLSLNPAKISGTCGRLMCCLKYEQDAYEDLIKTSPKPESFVDTVEGRGTVTDVNLMAQTVKVRMEKDPEEIRCFKNCDICVLRSGKAKKTDPPIPEELAPLSGSRTASAPEQFPRFERRRTVETTADERNAVITPILNTEQPEQSDKSAENPGKTQNRRRRQKQKPNPGKQVTESPKKPEQKKQDAAKKPLKLPEKQQKPAQTPQQPPAEGGKQKSSRNFYRHHRRGGNNKQGT